MSVMSQRFNPGCLACTKVKFRRFRRGVSTLGKAGQETAP